jgi:hypothetical protein
MRRPDCGPFGETFLEARVLAIVAALFVNRPVGGCVESVLTFEIHRFCFVRGIESPSAHRSAGEVVAARAAFAMLRTAPYIGNYTTVCGNNTVLAVSGPYPEAGSLR